ncbi:hypothetical protein CYMTET_29611 [Cymbomonas tetramitiformis]|uniref:Glucosamine/galactosamine-6-phosphate isomerase domain-containing protein n=1 Tax=Cymbomonas tetramitiformis TaxID=36881 RepID=A0AAE0KUR9_9CHLO|nr:hypothetical protein CYMTET_29611 [Cymbomonas tetramitiformis]
MHVRFEAFLGASLYTAAALPDGRALTRGAQVDERCSDEAAEHNFPMLEEMLLSHVPILPQHVHRMSSDCHLSEQRGKKTAEAYELRLLQLRTMDSQRTLRLDMVVLGMGSDGHVASLFPDTSELTEMEPYVRSRLLSGECRTSSRMVTPAAPLPPRVPRISLTLRAINSARHVALMVIGSEKHSAYCSVFQDVIHKPAECAHSPSSDSNSPRQQAKHIQAIRHFCLSSSDIPASLVSPMHNDSCFTWYADYNGVRG